MKKKDWEALVMQSNQGLYKPGTMGREVHEFEIVAAMKAQSIYAEFTGKKPLCITGFDFTTPPENSTYRSMTEPIHRTINQAPSLMESAWINVWHSVAEACYLRVIAPVKYTSVNVAYLAYCRECRDWAPNPPMFVELSPQEQLAWVIIEERIGNSMIAGFELLKEDE